MNANDLFESLNLRIRGLDSKGNPTDETFGIAIERLPEGKVYSTKYVKSIIFQSIKATMLVGTNEEGKSVRKVLACSKNRKWTFTANFKGAEFTSVPMSNTEGSYKILNQQLNAMFIGAEK